MFMQKSGEGYNTVLDGIRMKTLNHGEKTLMVEFQLDKGRMLPRHAHPHEQAGYLVSGRLRLLVGDESFLAEPGDNWCIAGGVEHGAEVLEDSVAIEVFSPVREDYLPK